MKKYCQHRQDIYILYTCYINHRYKYQHFISCINGRKRGTRKSLKKNVLLVYQESNGVREYYFNKLFNDIFF